ncbi:Hypothetical protein NGAL_HAMBI2610_31190 [Neorhizobium galegae bv. orientalis]|nr:Hypothetical protein NGAL_HAMBI2610_31190 [Neorhizobium galegae bv. orientalis]
MTKGTILLLQYRDYLVAVSQMEVPYLFLPVFPWFFKQQRRRIKIETIGMVAPAPFVCDETVIRVRIKAAFEFSDCNALSNIFGHHSKYHMERDKFLVAD